MQIALDRLASETLGRVRRPAKPKLDVNRAPRRIASMLTGIALALTVVKYSAARKYGPPREAQREN